MKRNITILLLSLFAFTFLKAQTSDVLTNSTIIKMVKANLSDDIIIDQISSSKVNFNISPDSIKFLTSQHVSAAVIGAMKSASPPPENKVPVAPPKPVETAKPVVVKKDTAKPLKIKALPPKQLPKAAMKTDSIKIPIADNSAFNINTVSYVGSLKLLIIFYNNLFASDTGFIQKWQQKIKQSLDKQQQMQEKIAEDERLLNDKMNAAATGFSNDILNLKNQLAKERDAYKQSKIDMVNQGKVLSAQLKSLSKETDKEIAAKFNEVGNLVIKSHPDPAVADTQNSFTFSIQKPDAGLVNHIVPVNVVLVCYENAIIPIRDTIVYWNNKALTLIRQDSKLAEQLEPLKKELQQFLTTPKYNQKLNKQRISELKKQCTQLTNDRKLVAKQMTEDSKMLSKCLNQIREVVRVAVKDRFMDAIENIDHSYEDKL